MPKVYFISGHLDLTQQEFDQHYRPKIEECLKEGHVFIVGDARGADTMAQTMLCEHRDRVTVFHMFKEPRNNVGGFRCAGGFKSDEERDADMTAYSHHDIAWVRPGREKSGTAKNIARRSGIARPS